MCLYVYIYTYTYTVKLLPSSDPHPDTLFWHIVSGTPSGSIYGIYTDILSEHPELGIWQWVQQQRRRRRRNEEGRGLLKAAWQLRKIDPFRSCVGSVRGPRVCESVDPFGVRCRSVVSFAPWLGLSYRCSSMFIKYESFTNHSESNVHLIGIYCSPISCKWIDGFGRGFLH